MTTLAVVVPTFRRPTELARCLAALAGQHRPADEIVVVTRRDDDATAAVAHEGSPGCTVVAIDEPGVLAAMAAGAAATRAEVVCFTDDDAVAPPDWLARLEEAFADAPLVGGVGGRDVVFDAGRPRDEARTTDVGRTTWYGRHVGGHHLGEGPARDVSFLKGVNAAYRRGALGLPVGLRGTGAQAHFEVAVGRFATTRGYRLVYDPSITVDHHPASRHGDDQRAGPTGDAVRDAAYNLVVATGGARGLVRVAYATTVGDRGAPGVVRALVARLRGDGETARRLGPSLRGSIQGGASIASGRAVTYVTFD